MSTIDLFVAGTGGISMFKRYRLLGIEHDGLESVQARVISEMPDHRGRYPLHTFKSGDEVVDAVEWQAAYDDLTTKHDDLAMKLTEVTAERDAHLSEVARLLTARDILRSSLRSVRQSRERAETLCAEYEVEIDLLKAQLPLSH